MNDATVLGSYIRRLNGTAPDPAAAAFYATLDQLMGAAPLVAQGIVQEFRDQRSNVKLIASENYSSLSVQLATANLLTDKYAEGYPYHRFYAGCDTVDLIESEAAKAACRLFDAEHAYVQPHSGADANLVSFAAILLHRVQNPMLERLGERDLYKLADADWATLRHEYHNQRLLGMDYYSGGHLTHGYRLNISSQLFDCYSYSVNRSDFLIDYDDIRAQLHEIRPLVLLAGYSAYPRKINFAVLRELADEVGAVLMVDMAHFAGLVAGGVFAGDFNPVPFADIVTATTHKTLRGPRGGLVLCKEEFAEAVDKGCPTVLGGPMPHIMAAKLVAFQEALQPEFGEYARLVVENANALAEACGRNSMQVLTGGTDNHLVMIDVTETFGLTGRQAESALRQCGISLNRNSLPFDKNGPWYTSGLRLGTPAVSTLGMGGEEMDEVADIIHLVLRETEPATISRGSRAGELSKANYLLPDAVCSEAHARVSGLLSRFKLYPTLDLEMLLELVGTPESGSGGP